jgi:hypothetical protein
LTALRRALRESASDSLEAELDETFRILQSALGVEEFTRSECREAIGGVTQTEIRIGIYDPVTDFFSMYLPGGTRRMLSRRATSRLDKEGRNDR